MIMKLDVLQIHSQIRNIYSKFFVLKKQEFEPYIFSLSQYLP